MISSLLYLIASKLDIMLSVCLCARYQLNPKESHFSTVNHIMGYLVGTLHLGLWYPKSNTYNLLSYSNADFAGSRINWKSTIRGC